jgi:ribonuclease HI
MPPVEGRRRDRETKDTETNSETPKKKGTKEMEEEKQIKMISKIGEGDVRRIVIHFDGACRNNGHAGAKGAIGVFTGHYDSRYNVSKTTEYTTNNQNEVAACSAACSAVLEICELQTIDVQNTEFKIQGDSGLVIDTITSGRIFGYKASSRIMNSTLWVDLQRKLQRLYDNDIKITFTWVSRRYNAEADELANCALDSRPPNKSIVSTAVPPGSVEEELLGAASSILACRRRHIKVLPEELRTNWTAIVNTFVNWPLQSFCRRLLILLCPTILSAYQHNIGGRAGFKRLRTHISNLQHRPYLLQVLADIRGYRPTPVVDAVFFDKPRIKALCALGLHAKVIRDDSITVADLDMHTPEGQARFNKINDMFPQRQLPETLPAQTPVLLEWADLVDSMRKLKRGKAAGLTGWNRELLSSLIGSSANSTTKNLIVAAFESWANNDCERVERELMTCGRVIPLMYTTPDQFGKIRPIIVPEVISKTIWIALITRTTIRDPHLKGYGTSYGRNNGAAIALRTIQHAVDAGEDIVVADGANTFNNIYREKALQHVLQSGNTYYDLFPMLNLFYTQPTRALLFDKAGNISGTIKITSGTGQGWVQGPLFLQWAMIPICRKWKNIVGVSDDVTIARQALATYKPISEDFAQIGMFIGGAKRKIITKKEHIVVPEELQGVTVYTKTVGLLGGVIVIDKKCTVADMKGCLRSGFTKKLIKAENLPTTAFLKFQILRVLQWSMVYLISTLPDIPQASDLLDQIDRDIQLTVGKVLQLQVSHDLHHCPLEVGGLGFLPLQSLHKYLQPDMINQTAVLCREIGIPTIAGPPPQERSPNVMKAAWRHIAQQRGWYNVHGNPTQDHKSWLTVNPHAFYTSPEDSIFITAMHYRLGRIQPFDYVCPLQEVNPNTMTPEQVCQHVDSCLSCGAPAYHLRHENVVMCIEKTLKKLSLIVESNPKDLPLPGKRKGGPDFVIWSSQPTLAGDVCITCNRTKTVFNNKIRKYSEFCEQTRSVCFPFAMTTLGEIDSSSLQKLSELAQLHDDRRIFNHVSRYSQFACITGQAQGIIRLKARDHLKKLAAEDLQQPLAT